MIKAPNYTQTPNVFFDEIMPTLKFGELKVLFVINRQTFGFHKEWDRISVSQLMKKTGMTKVGQVGAPSADEPAHALGPNQVFSISGIFDFAKVK